MHLICQSWLSNIVHHPVSVCDHVADWELQLALPNIVGNVVPTSQSRKALKFNMILLNVTAYRREKKVQVKGATYNFSVWGMLLRGTRLT